MEVECKKCGKWKDSTCFNKVETRKRGFHVWCKECLREYDHERHQSQRPKILQQKKARREKIQEWLKENKKPLCCSKCSENDPVCMDFHHIDESEKDFNIGEAITKGYSIKRIETEMKKCVVLCANCHRKEHAKQTANP